MMLVINPQLVETVINNGAKGIFSIAIIAGIYLLFREQKKEEPRKSMFQAIFGFLGFCLVFGIILIFNTKSEKEDKYTILVERLNALSSNQGTFSECFIIDKNGDSKNPKIKIDDSLFISLTKNLDKNTFRSVRRNHKFSGDSIHISSQSGTSLGYIESKKLKADPLSNETKIKQEDLLYASLKRGSIPDKVVKYGPPADAKQAARYLTKILNDKSEFVDSIRTNAGKGLVHDEMLNKLESNQFEALLKYLNSGKRKLPFRHFELAQVYTVLSSQELLFKKEVSSAKRDSCYNAYISWWSSPSNRDYYKNKKPKTYTTLERWDNLARKSLEQLLAN